MASESTADGNDNTVRINYAYTYPGNGVTRLTTTITNRKDADGVSLEDAVTVSETDMFGNVIYTQDARGGITTMEYDLLGRQAKQTNPDGTVLTNVYDTANNTILATDAKGNQIKYTYDAWGNLLTAGTNFIVFQTFHQNHLSV